MKLNCYGSIKLKLEKDETRSMGRAGAPEKRPNPRQERHWKEESDGFSDIMRVQRDKGWIEPARF
jgi:hypothetical protein